MTVKHAFDELLRRVELNSTRIELASTRYNAVKAHIEQVPPGKSVVQVGSFMRHTKIRPRDLGDALDVDARVEFGVAHRFSTGVALLLQIVAILAGGLLPLLHQPGYFEIVAVAIVGVVAGMIRWWSNYVRGSGESLFSKVEGENQLGWRIPPKMNLDVYAKANLEAAAELMDNVSNYWVSTEPPGARRGVECVQESSWWSEHLARGLGILAFSVSIVLLLVGSPHSSPCSVRR